MKKDSIREKIRLHLSRVKHNKELFRIDDAVDVYLPLKGKHVNRKGIPESHDHILHDKLRIGFDEPEYSKFVYLYTFRDKIVETIKSKKMELDSHQTYLTNTQNLVYNFFLPITFMSKEDKEDLMMELFGFDAKIKFDVHMKDRFKKGYYTRMDVVLDEGGRFHTIEGRYAEREFGVAQVVNDKDLETFDFVWNEHGINHYSRINELIHEVNDHFSFEDFLDSYQLIRNTYNTFFDLHGEGAHIKAYPGYSYALYLKQDEELNVKYRQFALRFDDKYKENIKALYWDDLCNKAIHFFSKKGADYEIYRKHYSVFNQIYIDIQ